MSLSSISFIQFDNKYDPAKGRFCSSTVRGNKELSCWSRPTYKHCSNTPVEPWHHADCQDERLTT